MIRRQQLNRLVWILPAVALLIAGAADAVRYLQPAKCPRLPVEAASASVPPGAQRLIIVYNANGGFFPGLVDVIWKEASPTTYPCNLCLHAFGRFGPKEEWRNYLSSLPYPHEAFHKDAAKRLFAFDGPFPAVLLANDTAATLLLSASRINTANSLEDLLALMDGALAESFAKPKG